MEKPVTIGQVAQRAGIGLGTASRALSGRGSVSPKTRARVIEIASNMGYEANPHAQRLANGRVDNTVAIFAGIDLGVATLRLWQVQSQLNDKGYITDVHLLPSFVSNQEQRQIKILRDLCRLNPVAIVSQTMGLDEGARHELQKYQENGGVAVTFDVPTDLRCDQVIFDQEDSTYQAAQHLLEMGHRSISYCQHTYQDGINLRLQGMQQAMRDKGITPLKNNLLFFGELTESAGNEMVEAYFSLKEKPTAIIANDAAAAVFMHAVMRRGIRVPEDLSIVGYDNTMPAQNAFVPITSVAYPVQEIGQCIAGFVQDRLNGSYQGPPRIRNFKSTLVERSSVAPPRGITR